MATATARGGASRQLSQGQIDQLVLSLTNAIARGDRHAAGEVAKHLAAQHAVLNVQSMGEAPGSGQLKGEDTDDHITLNVVIEDRIDSNKVTANVWPAMTFLELKIMFYEQYHLPMECQKWIHSRSIKKDSDTLQMCGITTPGHTVYLYLVSKRTAHIPVNRQDYRPPEHMLSRSRTQSQLSSGMSVGSSPITPGTKDMPSLAGSGARNAFVDAGAMQQPQHGLPPVPHFQRQPAASIPINLAFLPGPGGSDRLPAAAAPEEPFLYRPVDIPVVNAKAAQPTFTGGLTPLPAAVTAQQIADATPMNIPLLRPADSGNLPVAVLQDQLPPPVALLESADEAPEDGWNCPACTLLNHPTRPGCHCCAQERPADYVVPERFGGEGQRHRIPDQVFVDQQRLLERQQADRQRVAAPEAGTG